ncbi:MAG: heme ABC exporter ATP-binding protein CcmA [Bryobacterales bacterium]|nr:heme ABC exporter ATP-binding protein CcmA [Bryobacterales bacterium]
MSEPAILASGVSKYFGDFPAVLDVSLEVAPGNVLAMLGRNGAGKTTLLRMFAGLSRPTQGDISFPASSGDQSDRRGRIGIVGHGTWIYDDLTAEENLRFFCKLYKVPEAGPAVEEWLHRVGLERFRRSRVGEYSRGMRQRLTIARAFLHKPEVLLLDEPWTSLDDRAVELLSSLVEEAREANSAIVICSHQLREAIAVADEVTLLHRGRLAYRGAVDADLRNAPQSLYERLP